MSDEHTTITLSRGTGREARGVYVLHPLHDTPMRVVKATDTTWTIRYTLGWAWAERLLAKWEDWVVWPLSDLLVWIRRRVS